MTAHPEDRTSTYYCHGLGEIQVSHWASIDTQVLGDCLILLGGVGLPAPHWASTDISVAGGLGVPGSCSSHGLHRHHKESVLIMSQRWWKSCLSNHLNWEGQERLVTAGCKLISRLSMWSPLTVWGAEPSYCLAAMNMEAPPPTQPSPTPLVVGGRVVALHYSLVNMSVKM